MILFYLHYVGQFWNIPITVSNFTGELVDPNFPQERYVINVTHPDSADGPRLITGILDDQTWEFEPEPCFYVGNSQGGSIYEVKEPNDPVIEGNYEDYVVSGQFETMYTYSRFDEGRCS